MTTQQRRDQIQIIEFEGFAALEQLLLIQDEREQSQQIRDMQAFDEERQQEFNRIHNWDQRRLLDYQENRNTLVDEPNDDDQQQITSNRMKSIDNGSCSHSHPHPHPQDRQLWQSYLDIGLQQHLWPDQFYTMAKTNDFDLCEQYVMNYIENNKKQLNHCQSELTKQEEQFQTCPMIELSFEQIEQRLKELVDRERKYLSKRNNDKLIKFKDDISEKQRLTTISTS
ncbi:unnamed protein product, partial [Rotaria socialis]